MLFYSHRRHLIIILSIIASSALSYSDDDRTGEYLLFIGDSLNNRVKSLQVDSKNSVLKQALTLTKESIIRQVFPEIASDLSRWYLLRTDQTEKNQITALQNTKDVVYLQVNHHFRIHSVKPNDPLYEEQWYHHRLNAVESWDNFTTNPDIILAVIDTGIDYEHPDLSGSLWINPAEDLNANGKFDNADINLVDDDGNGYVDDVIGWDFTDAPRFPDGGDYIDPDNDPKDEYPGGHGTKIAGLISAATNNAVGIAALLPESQVMNLRAGTSAGYLEEDDVAQAVLYAVNNGARIINMSFGDIVLSKFLSDVIEYAYSRGILIIASAGNSGSDQIYYPAGLAQTISVGATDSDDNLAGFSSWGHSIDLVAPGVDLLMPRLGGGYERSNGTSFSAPMVAAAAAMLLSVNPDYSTEQIRNILKTTADDIGEPGWDPYFGAGRLNMLTASRTTEGSSLHILHPSSESTLALDSISVVVTAQDPDLLSLNLSYAFEDNPQEWFNIVFNYPYQIIEDTLANFDIRGIPDATLILKLELRTWLDETFEYRSFLKIDRTKPHIINNSHLTILDDAQYAALIEFETDDITTASLYYREEGAAGPFKVVNLSYQAQLHNYLLSTSGHIEYYLRVINLSGLDTTDTNNGKYYTVEIPVVDFGEEEFLPVEWSLPAGYMLAEPTDFDHDGDFEIVISRYTTSGSFGPVEIYEFTPTGFVKRTETSFNAIPRDFGDTDQDGLDELLLGYGQNSYILEADQPNAWPSVLVWADSGDFWISRISDLDNDGNREISGKEGNQFVIYESDGNNHFTKIGVLPNPSPGENQLGPPRVVVTDLDQDGFQELIYGDYDGDIIIYENKADNQFEFKSYISLPLKDATDHFTSGRIITGTGESLIAGSHKGSDDDYEHDFGSRYWNYSVIESVMNDSFSSVQEITINGFSGLKNFDSGLNAGMLTSTNSEYLFLAPHPDLYLFKAENETMIPVWHLANVNTNTVVVHDFDSDGNAEFYYNTGEKIVGYEKNLRNKPTAPISIQATPQDTSTIALRWQGNLTADRFIIYRGLDSNNMVPHDSLVSEVFYLDSNLVNGQEYYYALQTIDHNFEYPRSDLSKIVSAVPNSPPHVTTLLIKNEKQIEIYFNETMDLTSLQSDNFYFNPDINPVSSVVPFLNGKAVLVSFLNPFPEDTTFQLELISVRDSYRTPLIDEDRYQFFTYIAAGEDKPYVQEWHFEDSRSLILKFNTAMDIESVLEIENYQLEPSGNVLTVEIMDPSSNEYRLKLSSNFYRPSSGITTYIILNKVKSHSGTELTEGNRIALVSTPENINHILLYPQPVTPDTEWIMFANIAPGTDLKIFDINGHFIYTVREEDNNGGVRWNLKDQSGKKISAGIYIYFATYKDQQKIGKFAVIK